MIVNGVGSCSAVHVDCYPLRIIRSYSWFGHRDHCCLICSKHVGGGENTALLGQGCGNLGQLPGRGKNAILHFIRLGFYLVSRVSEKNLNARQSDIKIWHFWDMKPESSPARSLPSRVQPPRSDGQVIIFRKKIDTKLFWRSLVFCGRRPRRDDELLFRINAMSVGVIERLVKFALMTCELK